MRYRMVEEVKGEEGVEVELKGKEAAEVDNKAEAGTVAHRVLHILQTRVVKEGSTTLRTTLVRRMAREDPIPRTTNRLDREVQGIRITWVVGVHPGTKEFKVTEVILEPAAVEI